MNRVCLVCVVAIGCTGGIEMPAGGDDVAVDAMPEDNPAVARAELWVAAQLPYCQAANHQRDYDSACASTCTRPDNPDWDPYRSDCSGLVSWAWGLPPPGRITTTFAPFDTAASHTIAAKDLAPGDAVNNSDHMMLFKAWTMPGAEATFIEEPGCSSATPYAHEFTETVTLDGETIVVAHHGTFTAIRQQ